MTPDQAIAQVREGLLFLEAELEARCEHKALRRVRRHHAGLQDVADDFVQSGDVSALSVGDKPEGP